MIPFAFALALCAPLPQDRVEERRASTAVMLHRGSSDLAVENTLAALEATFLHGGDGVEIDIRRTRDGVLVLMHDPWIDRVLDAYGNVADWTYHELLLCRFREPYGFTRADERVPTVVDAFELCRKYSGLLHLDIKIPGADRELLELLARFGLTPNVVRVNPFNDAALKADERIRQLPSQGAIIHGNNDYDPKAVKAQLDRPKKGTFLVDDPRAAVSLLGRPVVADRSLRFKPWPTGGPEVAEALLTTAKYPRRQALAKLILRYPDVARKELILRTRKQPLSDRDDWIWALGKLAARHESSREDIRKFLNSRAREPVIDLSKLETMYEANGEAGIPITADNVHAVLTLAKPATEFPGTVRERTRNVASIRLRARIMREIRRAGLRDKDIIETLRTAIRERSYHIDGAWHGLDGAEAVKALAAIDPKNSVAVFKEAVLRIDPGLEPVTKHEEHPWWLRRTASWWDFRIKTEALRALGRVGTPEAAGVLRSFLEIPAKKAESIWRELHWDSARALCGGTYRLSPEDLAKLFGHETSSVRRTAAVHVLRHYRTEFRPVLDKFIPWAKAWVKR